MKIKVTDNSKPMKVKVWFGTIKQGYVWKNGNIDLETSRAHYNYHWDLRQKAARGEI